MGKPVSSTNILKGSRNGDVLQVTQRLNEAWTVDGGAGDDIIKGGAGSDTLLGGNGNDIIFGALNDVRLDGGGGYDTLDLSLVSSPLRYLGSYGGQLTGWPDFSPETYTVASGFERVIGGSASDFLLGGSASETLVGGGGSDHIEGGAGNDVLVGDYLSLESYNPLNRNSLPTDRGADYFEFSHYSGGQDRILDFELGIDHLFFYGVPQPDISKTYVSGDDLVVPWANGIVTLVGLGGISASSYGDLFTTTNGDISIV